MRAKLVDAGDMVPRKLHRADERGNADIAVMTRTTQALGLLVSLLLVSVVATFGGLASVQAAPFYRELVRPPWSPPPWIFGPVWTMLYILMGVAAWRVWRGRGAEATAGAIGWHVLQLILNALWSWIFFAWHEGMWASIEIVVLWVVIVLTIGAFRRHDRIAAWLMVPYLAWVTFAMALTFALTYLNPLLL